MGGDPVKFRRGPVTPPRRPHPDPATELALQEILGLLARADQKVKLIDDYRAEIRELHKRIRQIQPLTDADVRARTVKADDARIGRLQQEIRAADAEIDALRAQVAGAQRGMDPNDLAYLWS
jgi:predicted RNase H-like nuclease (RuvC/YqgF family)